MNPFLDFILHGLATYRLALMISKEDGPGWMFKLLRRKVKRKAPKATHMDEGIECLWCMSMQIGLVVAVARAFLNGGMVYTTCVFALATSAVAVILNQAFTKD